MQTLIRSSTTTTGRRRLVDVVSGGEVLFVDARDLEHMVVRLDLVVHQQLGQLA